MIGENRYDLAYSNSLSTNCFEWMRQIILWWEHFDLENLKIFQHKNVVFGLKYFPFLNSATIQYNLKNDHSRFLETADRMIKSFYVDNWVTDIENHEELDTFIEKSQVMFQSATLDLRGWEYNPYKTEAENFPLSECSSFATNMEFKIWWFENRFMKKKTILL